MHKGHFFADYSSTIPVLPILLKLRQDTASEHKKHAPHTTPHPETHMYFLQRPIQSPQNAQAKKQRRRTFYSRAAARRTVVTRPKGRFQTPRKKGGHKPSGITPCIRRSSRHQFWRRFPVQTWRDRQTCSARFYPAASTVH